MEAIDSDVDEFKTRYILIVDKVRYKIPTSINAYLLSNHTRSHSTLVFSNSNSNDAQLEKIVKEVEQFYSTPANTANKGSSSIVKDKDKDKDELLLTIPLDVHHLHDSSQKEATASKRMQELMCHFALIFRQAKTQLFLIVLG